MKRYQGIIIWKDFPPSYRIPKKVKETSYEKLKRMFYGQHTYIDHYEDFLLDEF